MLRLATDIRQSSDHNAANLTAQLEESASCEISELLSKAVHFIDRDQETALECMKLVSALLKPRTEKPLRLLTNSSGGLAPWQANRLRAHVEERISHTITLDELAKLVKLSTSYFSAAFKVTFGTSPHAYVLSRRVAHAKHLMLTSDAPLCQIALDCGLSDQAHLSRVFRKLTGVTPSMWRRYHGNPPQTSLRLHPWGPVQVLSVG
ncbi:helix-turn-helix domain-containing protein [Rhizobium oryzicola]|nr:AraC family transcriptional regulator [Rhizobium oryzicola]